MTIFRIGRALVTLASVTFTVVALAIWAAPERAAQFLGVEAISPSGLGAVQTEVGGLFLGLAILCGAAAWTRSRAWAFAAVTVLAAIVCGRTFAWVGGGGEVAMDVPALAVELGVIAALTVMTTGSQQNVPRVRRVSRPLAMAAALVVPVGGVALMTPGVQQRVFDAGAEERAATVNTALLEDDALRVAVCGSSAPLPSAARAKACVAVFAGGKFYVVDAGPESVENLVLWGMPMSSIGGVLLTHFHSDHIGDLGELNLQTWAAGRTSPLAVYGGPGVDEVVDGFNRAYRHDQGYRTAHHTAKVMPPATWAMVPHPVEMRGPETTVKYRSEVVLDDGALRITAFEVDHPPIAPAYAYRFDYKGRSAFITGDLKFHPELVKAASSVDVLVSEAIAVQMTRALGKGAKDAGRSSTAAIMHDIEDYHITPQQAASIANDAQVKLLVFYHLLPAPDGFLPRRVFAQGISAARRGDWTIADDGSLYTLPIGSTSVRIGSIAK